MSRCKQVESVSRYLGDHVGPNEIRDHGIHGISTKIDPTHARVSPASLGVSSLVFLGNLFYVKLVCQSPHAHKPVCSASLFRTSELGTTTFLLPLLGAFSFFRIRNRTSFLQSLLPSFLSITSFR